MLWELGFPQESTTPIYEDNNNTIDIVKSSIQNERTHHIDVLFFAIQGYKEAGDIIMHHIPGITNPADYLNKPLASVLYYRHDRYLMGDYNTSFE